MLLKKGPAVAFVSMLLGTVPLMARLSPVTVSPGSPEGTTLVEARCPTFSWGVVEGAESYELVVYIIGREREELRGTLRQTLPGSVGTWTPALERCLVRGGSYAWSVRSVVGNDAGEWSPPAFFRVAGGRNSEELEEALDIVRRYLGGGAPGHDEELEEEDLFPAPGASSLEVEETRGVQEDEGLLNENASSVVSSQLETGYESEPLHCDEGTIAWQIGGKWGCILEPKVQVAGVSEFDDVGVQVQQDKAVMFAGSKLGAGDKLLFLPEFHAFRVGTVSTGAGSVYWDPVNIGLYSFASGLNTRAQGYGATAMGRDTEAENSYAFASGFFSNANGQYSTAMGFNTDAEALGSTALGYGTDAEQNYSLAGGYFAEAQAIYSIALGNAVRAQSYASMAVGRYNVGGGSATSWLSNDPIFEIGIGTGPSTRANAVTVRKNGNVGIGTTFPADTLHVNGRLRIGSLETFEDGGSFQIAINSHLRPTTDNSRDLGTSTHRWDDVYATNGTINTSDRRAKENIADLGYGLEEVLELRPVSFTWKDNPGKGRKLGLIAQDVAPLIPEAIPQAESDGLFGPGSDAVPTPPRDSMLGLYYSDLIPVLVRAIQDQQALLEAQAERIRVLERRR